MQYRKPFARNGRKRRGGFHSVDSRMSSVHYNLDYLQQVFQGNDAMVRRILDSFEEQVPRYLADMQARWRQGDWQNLHPLAHKARSSISMLGMTILLEDIQAIERISRKGESPEDIGDRLDRAAASLDLALAALRHDREGRKASPERRPPAVRRLFRA